MCEILSLISSALDAKISKSSPKIFTATSALTPVINSLKRISIGWVNSISKSGIACNFSLNKSANSSLEFADTHWLLGLNLIITSLSSIDIGSVGTSAAPILETTCLTSGKLFSKICSILVVISAVLVNDVPVFNTGCITKSPSSNVGINSPPILVNAKTVTNSKPNDKPITAFLFFKANFITGSYNL